MIEEKLIPHFIGLGFVRHALPAWQRESAELRYVFPFGHLKRIAGTDLHIVEIQIDRRHRPRFVINFGVAHAGVIKVPWREMQQDEVGPSDLPENCRLYSNRTFMTWFSGGWFAGDDNAAVGRAVDRAVYLGSEIEDWFQKGLVGAHMTKIENPIHQGLIAAQMDKS